MKNFPSQRQYIITRSIDSEKTIVELKHEYKKLYFKEYNKRRNKKNKITLRPTIKEWEHIYVKKKEYSKQSLNRFIIDCALAYLSKEYKAHDPQAVKRLREDISRTGSNINQIVHKLHLLIFQTTKNTYASDLTTESMYRILDGYEDLKNLVDELKQSVIEFMSTPPPHLANISWSEIKADKSKLIKLIAYLDEHLGSIK